MYAQAPDTNMCTAESYSLKKKTLVTVVSASYSLLAGGAVHFFNFKLAAFNLAATDSAVSKLSFDTSAPSTLRIVMPTVTPSVAAYALGTSFVTTTGNAPVMYVIPKGLCTKLHVFNPPAGSEKTMTETFSLGTADFGASSTTGVGVGAGRVGSAFVSSTTGTGFTSIAGAGASCGASGTGAGGSLIRSDRESDRTSTGGATESEQQLPMLPS